MATLRKRKLDSGRVVWEITHGSGVKRVRFVAGQFKDEAQNALEQFKKQLGLHGEGPQQLPLGEAIRRFGSFLETNRRPKTRKRYLRSLKTFSECFLAKFHPEVVSVWDVKPHHVEEFKRRRLAGEISEEKSDGDRQRELELRLELANRTGALSPKERARYGWLGYHSVKANVSKKTVNHEVQTVSSFFRWASRNNLTFMNPCAVVEKLRIPKQALPKFLTKEELRRFLEACREGRRRQFGIILLSGIRKGEAEWLTWEDISFELGIIFIRAKEGWQPKSDERVIPISPMLHELLVEEYANRRSEKWVFANRQGNQDTHLLETLKGIARRAGIKHATVHGLRHSFAVYLRESGASLADIADLLGHRDLATTQIYAKVQREHLMQQVARMGEKLSPLLRSISGSIEHGTGGERPKLAAEN